VQQPSWRASAALELNHLSCLCSLAVTPDLMLMWMVEGVDYWKDHVSDAGTMTVPAAAQDWLRRMQETVAAVMQAAVDVQVPVSVTPAAGLRLLAARVCLMQSVAPRSHQSLQDAAYEEMTL